VARHVVAELILDAYNRIEMARHGVTGEEAQQVPWNRNVTVPNPNGEAGSVLLVGETDGGRLLTVPLAPTDDPTTWRPATTFDASRHQRSLFDRRYR
jgi:hypothetical protein